MTDKQQELKGKHGTPDEFEAAVWNAHDQLFLTADEAVAAINKYRQEWEESGMTR
jgi:hypothetical protein